MKKRILYANANYEEIVAADNGISENVAQIVSLMAEISGINHKR